MRFLTLPPQLQDAPPARRWPLVMVIPPARAALPGLALPNGQWRRLTDGSIEAVFNGREELEDCLAATRAIRAAMAAGGAA